jgi:hypothetical protein
MKNLVFALSLILLPSAIAPEDDQIDIEGVVVIHYNATWNEKNNFTPVAKVKDAKLLTAWIDKDNTIKESEGIRSVPTIILYMDGKEIKRWEAGLAMSLSISPSDIQIEVDKLTGASKW